MRADPELVAEDESINGKRKYHWLVPFWTVVAVFGLTTYLYSLYVGVPIRDPRGSMFMRRVYLSGGLFTAFLMLDTFGRWLLSRREGTLWETFRERWTPQRFAIALTGLLAYHLIYLWYHNVKSWVVFQGFVDFDLLKLDKWMMFGHSPAVLLHNLLGEDRAAVFLAFIYESFSTLVPLAFVSCVVFANRIRDGFVYLTSAMWCWMLGAWAYYLLPSLGPFASAAHEFDGLTETLIVGRQERLLANREIMLTAPETHDAMASIGAFASLHTGVTFMMVLMLRYYGFRWAYRAMSVYLVLTMIATIYFGYHFIIDDIAGLILGALAVALGQLVIYPKRKVRFSPRSSQDSHETLENIR